MRLILRYFSITFKIDKLKINVNSVEENKIFDSFHNKVLLPYIIYFYLDEICKAPTKLPHAIRKID